MSSQPLSIQQSASWGSRYPSYQVDFATANTGKKMSFTKRRIRFRFGFPNLTALEYGKTGTDCRGEEHEVSFVWSLTSGRKSVVFDNQEVLCADGRQARFEFSWSKDNKHVYKFIAHATGGGDRQYDSMSTASRTCAPSRVAQSAHSLSFSPFALSRIAMVSSPCQSVAPSVSIHAATDYCDDPNLTASSTPPAKHTSRLLTRAAFIDF